MSFLPSSFTSYKAIPLTPSKFVIILVSVLKLYDELFLSQTNLSSDLSATKISKYPSLFISSTIISVMIEKLLFKVIIEKLLFPSFSKHLTEEIVVLVYARPKIISQSLSPFISAI